MTTDTIINIIRDTVYIAQNTELIDALEGHAQIKLNSERIEE